MSASAPIYKSHKKWSYWRVESAPTCAYVVSREWPHITRVIVTHVSIPGLPHPGSCREWRCGVVWGFPSTPQSIGNPSTAPHVYCRHINWWDVVGRVQTGVSMIGAVRLHSMDGWAPSEADVQAPLHGVLETAWLHRDETQQVGCLRWLESCPLM